MLILIGGPVCFLLGLAYGYWMASPNKPKEVEQNENDFSIEYYPISGQYYPKYKGWYLKTEYRSGIITKESDYLFADMFRKQEHAEQFIEKAKEHLFKKGVETIKYINPK